MQLKLKAIIFDRDGTLNQSGDPANGGYVLTPSEMKLRDGVADALQQLHSEGVRFFVFTQQGCMGKGLLTEAILKQIHTEMNAQLAPAKIEKFYYCPHTADEDCNCRKPSPRMLIDCLEEHGFAPHEVMVVGDSARDYKAAQNAGLGFVHIQSDNPEHQPDDAYIAQGGVVYDSVKGWVDTCLA